MCSVVTLLIAKAIAEPTEDSIRYAAASELLHNATLIHDDVADGSTQRRGQPTLSALLGPCWLGITGWPRRWTW